MASPTAIRSFAIALAIVIAIIEPQADGFVLHQNNTREKEVNLPGKSVMGTQNLVEGEKGLGGSKGDKTSLNDKKNNVTKVVSSTTETVTTDNVNNPTISSDTIEIFDSKEVTENNLSVVREAQTSTTTASVDMDKMTEKTVKVTEVNTITTTDANQFNIESKTKTDQFKNVNHESSTPSFQYTTTTSTVETEQTTTAETVQTTTTMSVSNITAEKTTVSMDPTIGNNSNVIPTTPQNVIETTVTVTTSASIDSNKTDDSKHKASITPSWKKYTTIDRKKTTSTEDIPNTTVQETMKAETSNSNTNFEAPMTLVPFSGHKVDLLHKKTDKEPMSAETAKASMSVESTIPSLNTISNDAKISDNGRKLGTVSTKRGGFLNFSENISTHVPHTSTTERESLESDRAHFVSNSHSQNHMVEDAIQEELLKEAVFSNNKQNSRNGDEKGVRPLGEDASARPSGDSLSVQPIQHDRNKTLYTISPNYRPMKKIDVQPAKPFLRDPDDNSWRNESISSLGIVFNPNNASKSFKEVLKNKTQTELNNLQERDNTKEDLPELRVRLEKIAEVRKTKKKKMNKNGEVVYTDYEEASAENSKEAKNKETTTIQPRLEIPVLTTPRPITELVLKSTPHMRTASRGEDEVTKTRSRTRRPLHRPEADPLTTEKARKRFNIAEYYDTTDEYDADYVTMSKIDLKKEFNRGTTETPRRPTTTARPPPPDTTARPPFPDRRPTVQYFPPLTTEKVSVGQLDGDFERKVNLFTFEQDPPPPPRPSFLSVPPLPIATERPHLTAPPVDRVPYTAGHGDHNYYATEPPRTDPPEPYVTDDETFHRGSYVIKHYRDFLAHAGADEDERPEPAPRDASPAPPPPPRATPDLDEPKEKDADYEYDAHFRRDVLGRFVDNFNENSERFKVDFPVLYNNSVVHRHEEGGRAPASSRAFLRRQYEGAPPVEAVEAVEAEQARQAGQTRQATQAPADKCSGPCSVSVELSPSYELQYYVPEQEQREGAPHYSFNL